MTGEGRRERGTEGELYQREGRGEVIEGERGSENH
jgi:hypothetical protein